MKNKIQTKRILTLGECAEYLGYATDRILKLVKARQIPFNSPNGRKLFFHREEINRWLTNFKKEITNQTADSLLEILLRADRNQRVQMFCTLLRPLGSERIEYINRLLDCVCHHMKIHPDQCDPRGLLDFGEDLHKADTLIMQEQN